MAPLTAYLYDQMLTGSPGAPAAQCATRETHLRCWRGVWCCASVGSGPAQQVSVCLRARVYLTNTICVRCHWRGRLACSQCSSSHTNILTPAAPYAFYLHRKVQVNRLCLINPSTSFLNSQARAMGLLMTELPPALYTAAPFALAPALVSCE